MGLENGIKEVEVGVEVEQSFDPLKTAMGFGTMFSHLIGEGVEAFFKGCDLTPRESKILIIRLGLRTGALMSLEETGKEFGITRERVRQIQAKALEKIRIKIK